MSKVKEANRYRIRTGAWGAYIWDSMKHEDMTLVMIVARLNGIDWGRGKKKCPECNGKLGAGSPCYTCSLYKVHREKDGRE